MALRPLCVLLASAALAACAQPPVRPTATPGAAAGTHTIAGLGPTIEFRCGPTAVQTRFGQDGMVLTLEGRTYPLTQAVSASGARYTGLSPSGPLEFWNTGNKATLTVGPTAYPECEQARH